MHQIQGSSAPYVLRPRGTVVHRRAFVTQGRCLGVISKCVWPACCFYTLGNKVMTLMAFVLKSESCLMTTDAQSVPFVSANTPWFRAAEVATYLGYAQPRVAITKVLRGHHTKRFCEIFPFQSTCKQDGPRARYVITDGLKVLCCKSRKPQSVSLANGLGINLDDMKTMMQETKTLAALCEIFKGEVINL